MQVASKHLKRVEHVRQVDQRELRKIVVEYVAELLGVDLADDRVTYRCYFADSAGGDHVANVIIWTSEPLAEAKP